jgi:hypothetical protein
MGRAKLWLIQQLQLQLLEVVEPSEQADTEQTILDFGPKRETAGLRLWGDSNRQAPKKPPQKRGFRCSIVVVR